MSHALEPVYSVILSPSEGGMSAKSAPTGSGMMGAYSYGAPWVDAYNKQRSPSGLELVRYCLDTVYACTSLNAEGVAATPLRLYVKTTRRRQKSRLIERGDTRKLKGYEMRKLRSTPRLVKTLADATNVEEVTSHPLLDLLAKPNDTQEEDSVGMSEYVLCETTQRYLEVVGRAYWYTERDGIGGTPSSIWILPGHLVQEIPATDGKRVIDHYVYSIGGNSKINYSPDEIIPFRLPDLHTGGYMGGFSPTRAAFEQVTIFRQYKALTIAQLQNGGKPSAIWSPAGEGAMIGSAQAVRMRGAFREAFAMSMAGGVMVMNQPGKLDMLSWPANEVVSPDQYALAKSAIANCFAVPGSKLDRNDANRASALTGDYAHAKDAILPRLRRNEAVLNSFYVPRWDDGGQLFLAYDEPEGLRDQETEQKRWEMAANVGSITRNEQREEIGLDPAPWGDEPVINKMFVGVDPTGKPDQPQPATTTPDKPQDAQQLTKPTNGKAARALRDMVKALADQAKAMSDMCAKAMEGKDAAIAKAVLAAPAVPPAPPPDEDDDDVVALLRRYKGGETLTKDASGPHVSSRVTVHAERDSLAAIDAGAGDAASGGVSAGDAGDEADKAVAAADGAPADGMPEEAEELAATDEGGAVSDLQLPEPEAGELLPGVRDGVLLGSDEQLRPEVVAAVPGGDRDAEPSEGTVPNVVLETKDDTRD